MPRRKRVKDPIKPGRPGGTPRLEDVQAKAVKAIRNGLPLRRVPNLISVPESTWWMWLAKGRDGELEYIDFARAVYVARELLCQELVAEARLPGADGQGARFLLERCFGFTKTERVEVVDARERTDEEIDEWLAEKKAQVREGDEQRVH